MPVGRDARRGAIERDLVRAVEARTAGGTRFAEVTVEQLADDAGISKSSFYMYFAHKSDLLRRWFEDFLVALEDAGSGWWDADGGVGRDELRRVFGRLFAAYRERAVLLDAVHEQAAVEPAMRRDFEEAFARTHRGLRAHIRAGQRAGTVAPALSADETAVWLTCMMERGLSQIVGPTDDLEGTVESCTDLVWSLLYAGA